MGIVYFRLAVRLRAVGVSTQIDNKQEALTRIVHIPVLLTSSSRGVPKVLDLPSPQERREGGPTAKPLEKLDCGRLASLVYRYRFGVKRRSTLIDQA